MRDADTLRRRVRQEIEAEPLAAIDYVSLADQRTLAEAQGTVLAPALLSLADLMVGNDTGPLHLAAALGKPCAAPYTCTRVALHGPYTQAGNCAETTVSCAGSYLKKCSNMVCMPELTADRLWPQLATVLDTWQRQHTSRSA